MTQLIPLIAVDSSESIALSLGLRARRPEKEIIFDFDRGCGKGNSRVPSCHS